MGQSIEGIHFMRVKLRTLQLPISYRRKMPTVLHLQRPYIEVGPEDILCWRFATQAFNQYQNLSGFGPECGAGKHISETTHEYYKRYPDYHKMHCNFVIYRVSNRLGGISLLQPNRSRLGAITGSLAIFGLIYGGIHLTAFTSPFHTQSERLLWIISSATVIAFVPISYVMFAITDSISKSPVLKKLKTKISTLLGISYSMLVAVAFMCLYNNILVQHPVLFFKSLPRCRVLHQPSTLTR
jgi:hypothetical protein